MNHHAPHRHFFPALALVLVGIAGSSIAAPQFAEVNSPGSGGGTSPGDPGELMYAPDVSDTDLLHGLVGVEAGSWGAPASRMNDGVHGDSFDNGAGTSGIAWPVVGASVTFTLGTGANGLGYDITSIQSIAAWQSAGFGNQGFTIEVKPVGGSYETLVAARIYNPLGGGSGATKITITDDGTGPGGILATGIEEIRFTQENVPGAVNGRTTYRELDVFGTDTVGGPDVTPPAIGALDPADDSTDVPTATNLVATFNESVTPGTGNVTIKNLTDVSDTTIAIDDTTQVLFAGNSVTIDPVAELLAGKDYAVQIDAGAIFDDTTNAFPGIIDTTTWNFSTDGAPPAVSSLFPPDDSTGVVISTNLVASFDEDVAPATGSITIKNLTDASDTMIAIDDTTQVTFLGSSVSIDPVADLLAGKDYAVQIDAGAIEDASGNGFPGIIDTTTWTFATDGMAPMSSSMGPMAGATDVSPCADLTLLFDEDVQIGTGNITIHLASDDSVVESIDVTSGAVTIDGGELTIDISALAGETDYYVNVEAGAFQDLSGNSFAGILDTTSWAFTTGTLVIKTVMSGPNAPSTTDDELTYAGDVSDSDLLHGIVGTGGTWNANGSSPDGLNDGDPGGDFDDEGLPAALNGASWAADGDGVSFREFELGTGSGSGFDITEIQSIAAWQGAGFPNQKYEVRVRLVGESGFPVDPLLTVDYQPFPATPLNNGGSTKVNITETSGILASGVEAIRFDILDTVSNNGGGVVMREIDVFGAETGSALQLTIAENGGLLDFAWNSMSGMQYDLVSSTSLDPGAGSWAIYDDGTMTYENIPATGMSTTLTGVMKVGPDRYFAVVEEEIPPLFSEDFESGDGGFTVATSAGTAWEHGGPDSSGPGGSVNAGNGSSANAWGTKLGDVSGTTADAGYYADSTITCLRSAVIDLTGVAGAELMFAEALDLEQDTNAPDDIAVVNIIDDTTDTVIAAAIYTATDGESGAAAWASVGPIAIPPAALGQPVRIEWCFNGFGGDTDDYLGWYIDDVVVTETFP